jgi:hypothetical protein
MRFFHFSDMESKLSIYMKKTNELRFPDDELYIETVSANSRNSEIWSKFI